MSVCVLLILSYLVGIIHDVMVMSLIMMSLIMMSLGWSPLDSYSKGLNSALAPAVMEDSELCTHTVC